MWSIIADSYPTSISCGMLWYDQDMSCNIFNSCTTYQYGNVIVNTLSMVSNLSLQWPLWSNYSSHVVYLSLWKTGFVVSFIAFELNRLRTLFMSYLWHILIITCFKIYSSLDYDFLSLTHMVFTGTLPSTKNPSIYQFKWHIAKNDIIIEEYKIAVTLFCYIMSQYP